MIRDRPCPDREKCGAYLLPTLPNGTPRGCTGERKWCKMNFNRQEINKEYRIIKGDNNMKINLFGKKRTTRDGKKTFITYFSTLTKKDGTEIKVNVKFREDAGQPEHLPCVIEFEKQDANLSDETYEKEVDGVKVTESKKVLWVNKFIEHEYIDKSLDDFE